MILIKNKYGGFINWGAKMGRKRIEETEKVKTLCINLQQKVIDELSKEGIPKNVIEKIINDKYLRYNN